MKFFKSLLAFGALSLSLTANAELVFVQDFENGINNDINFMESNSGFSLRSGNFGGLGSRVMGFTSSVGHNVRYYYELTFDAGSNSNLFLSFDLSQSTESSYDFFTFGVNNQRLIKQSGNSGGKRTIELSKYKDSNNKISIFWRFDSDGSVSSQRLYFDNIAIGSQSSVANFDPSNYVIGVDAPVLMGTLSFAVLGFGAAFRRKKRLITKLK